MAWREFRREQSGNPPQTKPAPARSTVEPRGHASAGLEQLEISARSDMADQGSPKVFCVVRMGRQNAGCLQEARQRQEVVERLCETLDKEGWHILRDSNVLRSGELFILCSLSRSDAQSTVQSAALKHQMKRKYNDRRNPRYFVRHEFSNCRLFIWEAVLQGAIEVNSF